MSTERYELRLAASAEDLRAAQRLRSAHDGAGPGARVVAMLEALTTALRVRGGRCQTEI